MTISHLSHQLLVCAVSKHPGLLTTMARQLAKPGFKVTTFRWDPEQNHIPGRSNEGNGKASEFPHASVFVLDGNSLKFGAELWIESVRKQQPDAKLLIVKETAKDEDVFPFLRMGAKGVVRYADAEKDLASAVKAVASGDFWIEKKQLVRFVDWLLSTLPYHGSLSGSEQLSRREREVLMSISKGLTNKEIASALDISERTVKFHVSHLLQKLGAHRRADLIARQYQLWPAMS